MSTGVAGRQGAPSKARSGATDEWRVRTEHGPKHSEERPDGPPKIYRRTPKALDKLGKARGTGPDNIQCGGSLDPTTRTRVAKDSVTGAERAKLYSE